MQPSRHSVRPLILLILWALALAAAFAVDRGIAEWVQQTGPIDKHAVFVKIIKLPGYFPFTACIAILLGLFHRRRWGAALALVLSAASVGGLYSVMKWVAGRHRPVKGIAPFAFHPFIRGVPGLWREPGLCFPSGHASLSFATAMCLALLLPRWRWGFFLVALLTCAERVLENAHYLSDVV
ncbi:MAG TPA: phosphatase PAP2 family protein, partial [Tepidisphaeraceae bacterium]|nr:phosphatase PAP2 family protein [Tepidisphaeraceae bacterium]